MRGKLTLYVDQYGGIVYAKTVRELCKKTGYGKASRMYIDTPNGTKHTGYVVGQRWFRAFLPYEGEA